MDPNAQELTLKYEKGTFTMPVGNLKLIFGEDYSDFYDDVSQASEGVSAHQRVRVIGQPASNVSAHTRRYTKWPTSMRSNTATGKSCQVRWKDSQGWWTGRYTGSAAALGDFMSNNSIVPVEFVTQRGKGYGPYNKDED